MPWKTPEFLQNLPSAWAALQPLIAPLMAFLVALVRVIYDRDETRWVRIILEATLCGLLAVVAGAAISAMGLDNRWQLFAGGVIGFVGSEFIRSVAREFIRRRARE